MRQAPDARAISSCGMTASDSVDWRGPKGEMTDTDSLWHSCPRSTASWRQTQSRSAFSGLTDPK